MFLSLDFGCLKQHSGSLGLLRARRTQEEFAQDSLYKNSAKYVAILDAVFRIYSTDSFLILILVTGQGIGTKRSSVAISRYARSVAQLVWSSSWFPLCFENRLLSPSSRMYQFINAMNIF